MKENKSKKESKKARKQNERRMIICHQ